MIDHLQTNADMRRAEHRRHWRIARAWEGRSVTAMSRAPSIRETDTRIASDVGAATLRCVSGHPFSLDGIKAVVERRHAAVAGFHSDALIIRLSGATHDTFIRNVIRVADLDAMFRIGRARLIDRGKMFRIGRARLIDRGNVQSEPAVDQPHGVGTSKARTTGMPASEEPGPSQSDASAFPIGAMMESDREVAQPRTDPHGEVFALSRRPVFLTRSRMRRWAPSGMAMARTIISAQLESRTSTIRQIHDCIVVEWRPEWGQAPGYDTVRRWVCAARNAARNGRLRTCPEKGPQPAWRSGDYT